VNKMIEDDLYCEICWKIVKVLPHKSLFCTENEDMRVHTENCGCGDCATEQAGNLPY